MPSKCFLPFFCRNECHLLGIKQFFVVKLHMRKDQSFKEYFKPPSIDKVKYIRRFSSVQFSHRKIWNTPLHCPEFLGPYSLWSSSGCLAEKTENRIDQLTLVVSDYHEYQVYNLQVKNVEKQSKDRTFLPYLMAECTTSHFRSILLLNRLSVDMATKTSGSSFHAFTTLLPKKCKQTDSLDRLFASRLSWERMPVYDSYWKSRLNWELTGGSQSQWFPSSPHGVSFYPKRKDRSRRVANRITSNPFPQLSAWIIAAPVLCKRLSWRKETKPANGILGDVTLWLCTWTTAPPNHGGTRLTSVQRNHPWPFVLSWPIGPPT